MTENEIYLVEKKKLEELVETAEESNIADLEEWYLENREEDAEPDTVFHEPGCIDFSIEFDEYISGIASPYSDETIELQEKLKKLIEENKENFWHVDKNGMAWIKGGY